MLVALQVALLSAGATYYVSSSVGDDNFSGTLPDRNAAGTDGPKQSLNAAFTLINSTAQPGDEVRFRRGDTWTTTNPLSIASASGTAANPIIVGAYGTGARPIIDSGATGMVALSVRGSMNAATEYTIVEDLHLTSTAPAGSKPQTGVNFQESFYTQNPPHHVTFRNMMIEGFDNSGVLVYANDITLEGCTIRNNSTLGLFTTSENLTMRNNLFELNGDRTNWFQWNTYLRNGRGYIFEGNESRGAAGGLKVRDANDTIVRGNIFHDLELVAITTGGDSDGGVDNVIIEANTIYDVLDAVVVTDQSGFGQVGASNIVIRNNLFTTNETVSALTAGEHPGYVAIANYPVSNVTIANNLFFGTLGKSAIFIQHDSPTNLSIRNNIYSQIDSGYAPTYLNTAGTANSIIFGHNLYDQPNNAPLVRVGNTNYSSLTTLQNTYPAAETNSLTGVADFVAAPTDLRLNATSPAIDSGEAMNGFVDLDVLGALRPQDGNNDGTSEWDIGPYELPGNNPVNLPALGAPDTYTVVIALNVAAPGVMANDSDPENDPLVATLATSPSNGTLIFRNDGSFDYQSNANFNGQDSFSYRLTDGFSTTAPIGVLLNVSNPRPDAGVPPAPDTGVIVDDAGLIEEDSGLVEEDTGVVEEDAGTIEEDGGVIVGPDGGTIISDAGQVIPGRDASVPSANDAGLSVTGFDNSELQGSCACSSEDTGFEDSSRFALLLCAALLFSRRRNSRA